MSHGDDESEDGWKTGNVDKRLVKQTIDVNRIPDLLT